MFSRFFIDRPIFATVIAILMVIAGVVALEFLPIAQFPDITPPTVQVQATYPGASAETIAKTVATPIEEQVNGVDGMIYMSSTSSSSGQYNLTVTFEVGTDADMAAVLVQNRVNIAEGNLPNEVIKQGITTKKQSTNIVMILSLEADSAIYDGLYLSNYATLNFSDPLSRLNGVGNVTVFGAGDYGMRVWLNPEVMRMRDVTTGDVYNAISAQNIEVSAGGVGQPPQSKDTKFQYTLTTKGRLSSVSEFENIIIKALPEGGYLRLKDIAEIELGSQNYGTVSKQSGKSAAAIAIYQLPGSNALDVADEVRERVKSLAKNLPEGVECNIVLDTTNFVKASLEEVVVTLIETTILVMLVVLIFLQNFRAVIIPSLTIPVSLICTLAVMKLFGFSINTLTLFGMVLAIAIVVDDAIIVVENSSRLLATGRYSRKDAVTEAMREITGPVIGVVLVLMAVFVPTAFIPGITGELYKQFALTIAVATFFSGFNSLTLTPALCALFLKETHEPKFVFYKWFNKGYEKCVNGYVSVISRMLRHPIKSMIAFAVFTIAAFWGFVKTPSSFIPEEDQGYFLVSITLPANASLHRTEMVTDKIGSILNGYDVVESYMCINGFSVINSAPSSNNATIFVILKPWKERKGNDEGIASIISNFNRDASTIEEASIFALNPPAINGMGAVGGLQMQIEDIGNLGSSELQKAINDMVIQSKSVKSIGQINTIYQGTTPQYALNINRDKVEMQGVNLEDVFNSLSMYMGSAYVNDFTIFGRIYQVLLSANTVSREQIEDVLRLSVRNSNGEMVPFSSFTTVEEKLGEDLIERYNMYSSASITGSSAKGYSSSETMMGMEALFEKLLGNSFGYEWTGEAYQENKAESSVAVIFILAIVVVILVLAAQYESWTSPIAVIMVVPFAILGAVLGTIAMGLPISVFSQIGIILLIALSAKNAILIVEFAADNRLKGEDIITASIEAGRMRLRPILMTSFAFIIGILPMLFATGAGAASRISLGSAVVFGMLLSTILGTLFIPNFYHLMQSLYEKRKRIRN
ncbi:MAG: multidrug efflux RND transporter permease subunit [Muribaculaceae bacterium]|nr:multidrug efflux RND transporter permease subunit [Muribaculaceae bacterium]